MNLNALRYLFVLVLFCPVSGNAVADETSESISYQEYFKKKIGLTGEELAWLNDHPTIKLAYDGHFPPYSFLNDSGKLEGFSVDVFNIISKRLGITIENHPDTTWKELYAAAKKREVDVVATMVDRPERAQWFSFTDPYVFKSLVIVTRKEDQSIEQRDDLAGKSVALVKDYQYVKRILEAYPTIKPHYVDTMLDGLNAVSTGQADATITFIGGGHYLRTKYLLTNLKFAAIYDKQKSLESIAVRNDWPELASILNKTLKSIPESEMQELLAKWLPVDYLESMVEVELTDQEKDWIEQHPTIRLGIDPEFAPFEYMDGGNYSGITSDYIKLLNQRLGLNMQIVEGLTWEEAIAKAKNKEVDILPIIGLTEQRQRFLNYTEPYISFHRVIITRSDTPFITGLDDIRGRRIAVQNNTSHEGYLREHTYITPVGYDTLSESILAVSDGKVDAFVGNVASATYWIRKLNLTNLKVAAPVSQDLQSLHFAVRKDWPELVPILQKGLDSISDRQRRKISEKWLLLEYDPIIDYVLVGKVAAALSVLLFIVLLWNVILKRKIRRRTSQLNYQAHYDQLTGLPNRFLILDRLSQLINEARRDEKIVAVISIDLDDFKKINDTLSHSAGDLLLKETARRLNYSLSESNTLGRPGGDEFIVLLGHLDESPDAVAIAENLLSNFRKPFSLDGRELTLTASLGIAVYPNDGDSPEVLFKNADSAMHHSKVLGRDTYAFYTKELNQQVARRLQLEEHIQDALKRNEFATVFQPKVDVETRQTVGFEALIRWYSPELGEVSPSEFIPVAENNNLIQPIGMFVLQQAFAVAEKLQQRFGQQYSMAVNFSPRQFLSKDLVSDVELEIKKLGIASSILELEITEGVLMSGYPEVDTMLKGLKQLGVTIAMDDFGTGYSSMSYLRKYPFDTLKIDREFINDLMNAKADRQLVTATIAMAHSLGMKVVAEGVESEEQLSILAMENCDLAQGRLFSMPMSYEDIKDMLVKQREMQLKQQSRQKPLDTKGFPL